MVLERLAGKKLVVYGTGHVAHKFHKALQQHHLQENIRCFVRTADVKDGEEFEGIRVCRLEDVPLGEDTLVCLAVHESLRDEIERTVRLVTRQYEWIYPYLYELMLGEAEQENVELEICRLLKSYRNDLRLGVRMAAIGQWEGRNTHGFDIYIRAQMLHCGRETAEKRLERFLGLMDGWRRFGYEKKYPVSVNKKGEVIDGNHRLAMAVYVGQKTIYGNVYPTELSAEAIHGREAMLPADLLAGHGFSGTEIQILEGIQRRYMDTYGTT